MLKQFFTLCAHSLTLSIFMISPVLAQQAENSFPNERGIRGLVILFLIILGIRKAIKNGKQYWWKKRVNEEVSALHTDDKSILSDATRSLGVIDKTVSKRDREIACLLPAADQGDATAQYQLGMLYRFGEPNDWAEAYKWLCLAKEADLPEAVKTLDTLERTMSAPRLEEAKSLLLDWRKQHPSH